VEKIILRAFKKICESKLRYINLIFIFLLLVSALSSCTLYESPDEYESPKTYEAPAPQTPQPEVPPENHKGIPWDEAKNYIGERVTVYGPVVSTHYASTSRGRPTFLNLGKPYPDPGRFTVVIWGENRYKFSPPPESYYMGKTISVTGLVTEYKGVPEIEVSSPSQIEVKE
jgi:DNA/RNA endonuclease YhcR with UshA esterase domain